MSEELPCDVQGVSRPTCIKHFLARQTAHNLAKVENLDTCVCEIDSVLCPIRLTHMYVCCNAFLIPLSERFHTTSLGVCLQFDLVLFVVVSNIFLLRI